MSTLRGSLRFFFVLFLIVIPSLQAGPLIWLQPAPDLVFTYITAAYHKDPGLFEASGDANTLNVYVSGHLTQVWIDAGTFLLTAPISNGGQLIAPTAGALQVSGTLGTDTGVALTADLNSFAYEADNPNTAFVFGFTVTGGYLAPMFSGGPTWLLMHNLGDPLSALPPDPETGFPGTGTGFPGNFASDFTNLNPNDTIANFGLQGVPEPSTVCLITIGLGLICWRKRCHKFRR